MSSISIEAIKSIHREKLLSVNNLIYKILYNVRFMVYLMHLHYVESRSFIT